MLLNGYIKRDRRIVAGSASSSNLPENALQWIAVLKPNEPEVSYKFVNT